MNTYPPMMMTTPYPNYGQNAPKTYKKKHTCLKKCCKGIGTIIYGVSAVLIGLYIGNEGCKEVCDCEYIPYMISMFTNSTSEYNSF